jgi:hypothetical protein
MAGASQARRSVGPSERRCLQLLGGIVGFVGFGTSIPAKDVAFASPATGLQVDMVDSSLPAVEIRRPINRPYQGHGYRGCCGSDCYSLALCSGNLREEEWGIDGDESYRTPTRRGSDRVSGLRTLKPSHNGRRLGAGFTRDTYTFSFCDALVPSPLAPLQWERRKRLNRPGLRTVFLTSTTRVEYVDKPNQSDLFAGTH